VGPVLPSGSYKGRGRVGRHFEEETLKSTRTYNVTWGAISLVTVLVVPLAFVVACGAEDNEERDGGSVTTHIAAISTEPGSPAGESPQPEPAMRPAPTGPATTELEQPVEVPLTSLDHLTTVEVRVDGEGPYQFVIDSGAPDLLRVSSDLAENLHLEQTGTVRSGDPTGKNATDVSLVRVGRVDIGGATFEGIDAAVGARLGQLDPDGIIGLGLFSGLTATFDYPRERLRLSREPLPAGGDHVIPFTMDRGVPQIEIEAAGVPLRVDVDTGGPAILTVPGDNELIFESEPAVVRRGRTATNEFDVRAADLGGELRIAGWALHKPTVEVVDVLPIASIGALLLRQYEVTFDMANNRLALAHS
jgi:Aspartyl protease